MGELSRGVRPVAGWVLHDGVQKTQGRLDATDCDEACKEVD